MKEFDEFEYADNQNDEKRFKELPEEIGGLE